MLTGLIYVCVCGQCYGVFIYRTQKGKWLCDLMRKAGRIFLHGSLRPNLKLKKYPALKSVRAGRYSYHRK
jgi:hypothetical protein